MADETTTETVAEETTEYDIDKLIDKPYSEMTEGEIEFVIDWKAQVKANEETAKAQIQAMNDHLAEVAAIHQAAADASTATLNQLVQNALAADEASKQQAGTNE